jgi:hypothetical protein
MFVLMKSFKYSSDFFPGFWNNFKSISFINRLVIAALLGLCGPVLFGQKEGVDRVVYNSGREIQGIITGIDSANVYCIISTEGYNIKRIIPKNEIKTVFYCNGTIYEISPDSCQKAIKMTEKTDFELALEGFWKNMIESEYVISTGVNVTFFTGNPNSLLGSFWDIDSYSKRIRLSYNVRFEFNSNINRKFAIQYGLEYSSKGLSLDHGYTAGGVYPDRNTLYEKKTFMVDYLQVPISVTFSPLNWQSSLKTYGYLRGGISPAVLIRSKYKYTDDLKRFFGIYYTRGNSDVKKLKDITPIDFNIFLAMGIRRWEHFGFEAKYEMGLKNITYGPTMLNSAISVNMVCYL